MDWKLPAFVVVLTACLVSSGSSQQCATMIGTPLEACKIAGYNSTFPLPYKMSNTTKRWVKGFLGFVLEMTQSKNCSIGLKHMGEMIMCAIYVPKCKEGTLMLPCKRVCVEFFNRCDGHIDPFWFDYFIAHCTLLPDFKASSGKCFEPPNFDKLYNVTSTGVLRGKCHKLIFPWCKGLKYQYTIMKESTQITTYRYLYGKDFTNDSSVDNIVLNTSMLNYWIGFQKNYSDCSIPIQKTLCADMFAPCFPHEGTSLYSVCQETCLDMRRRCPRIAEHETSLGNFFNSCEAWAAGSSAHGFCKQTSWAKPMSWLNYFKEKVPKTGPTTRASSSSLPTYVIVVVVVVPLVSLAVIAVVLLWRQRKQPWFVHMFKQSDDTTNIVEEEPEIQVQEATKT